MEALPEDFQAGAAASAGAALPGDGKVCADEIGGLRQVRRKAVSRIRAADSRFIVMSRHRLRCKEKKNEKKYFDFMLAGRINNY